VVSVSPEVLCFYALFILIFRTQQVKICNVQYFGSTKEILIRLKPQPISSAKLSSKIISLLGDDVDIRRVECQYR
jgi:hypothetical protein